MDNNLDLSQMTRAELNGLGKDIAKAIKNYDERKKKDALQAAADAASKHGFALSDLVGASAKAAKPSAPAKYRHPENPEMTWSGRGRQPAWFKEAVAAGTDKDALLVA